MHNDMLKRYRQDLHQIPEIAFDLFLTSAYLKQQLIRMGYQVENVAQTGVIAHKKGKSHETIAFRSDMDALTVDEQTGVSYKSLHPGKMHACGHDGHMSMLLGFADYVSTLKDLHLSILFIFQPAEESPGGAKVIIKEGILKRFNVKKIFGIHLYPGLDEGLYGLVDGPMLAQNGEFNLIVKGKSAHGAQPHLGSDAIVAASHLISMYQTIVGRDLDPLESGVITVGTISGGEARNIIAKQVAISGTFRSFNDAVYQMIKKRMRDIDHGISKAFNVVIENDIQDYYPPVFNDHVLYQMVKDQLDPVTYQHLRPMMFAEDFAFYQKEVPGLFVMLGTKNEQLGFTHPLHSGYFNFDEKVLHKGVELYIRIAKTFQIF